MAPKRAHLLDYSSDDPVERKHDIRLGAKHDPQRLLERRRVHLILKELLSQTEEMGIVVLGGIVARLDAAVGSFRLGETKADSDGVDGFLLDASEVRRDVLARQQAGIEELHVSLILC
jgi:hypothetical protein